MSARRTVRTEWGDAEVTEDWRSTRPDGVQVYDFSVTYRGEVACSGGVTAGPVDDLVVRDIVRHVVWRDTGDLPVLTREMEEK